MFSLIHVANATDCYFCKLFVFEIALYDDNVSLVTRTSYLGVTTISYDLTIGSSKHCQLNIVQLQIKKNYTKCQYAEPYSCT